MRTFSTAMLAIISLSATPMMASAQAQAQCTAKISLSVQGLIQADNYSSVNANFMDIGTNDNYSKQVKVGKTDVIEVPCGIYQIAATAVIGIDSASMVNEPVGQCALKSGPQTLSQDGTSVAITFPDDFICS